MIFNILVIIPNNQFDEDQLFPLLKLLESQNCKVVVLSKSGKESRGVSKTSYLPHGMIIDWNKQTGIYGKYNGIIVLGGKGAPKSLWKDEILPQILTDHFRAGSIIGSIEMGVVVLVKAGLISEVCAAPDDERVIQELDQIAVQPLDEPIYFSDNVLTAKNENHLQEFVEIFFEKLNHTNSDMDSD